LVGDWVSERWQIVKVSTLLTIIIKIMQ